MGQEKNELTFVFYEHTFLCTFHNIFKLDTRYLFLNRYQKEKNCHSLHERALVKNPPQEIYSPATVNLKHTN